jgi:DNA-directed RNA polymerase subunit RPC12/RpoP
MKCPRCNKEVPDKLVDKMTEELFCKNCGRWVFYSTLQSEKVNGGTMKPDNVTEQLKREYDGTTDYRL